MSRREIPRPPIRSVLEHYGGRTTGRETAGWIKATCCIHEDQNPSAQINEDTDKFRCFTCDFSGDAIALIMEAEKCDFPTALKVAATFDGARAEPAAACSINPAYRNTRRSGKKWTPPWL